MLLDERDVVGGGGASQSVGDGRDGADALADGAGAYAVDESLVAKDFHGADPLFAYGRRVVVTAFLTASFFGATVALFELGS